MCTEAIRAHFRESLGQDVDVSFIESGDPSKVILYHQERIEESAARSAYAELSLASPEIAGRIEHLVISYEQDFRLKWHGVQLP